MPVILYRLDWDAGAFAEVDVFRPDTDADPDDEVRYQLRYTPPFRGTFRPPVRELDLTIGDINVIVGRGLERLTKILNAGGASRGESAGSGADDAGPANRTTQEMVMLGKQMLSILEERRNILNDLRTGLFLSIGMDEGLLTYPWELMHDGEEFFCLKHRMGRIVNSPVADPPSAEGKYWWGNRLENFRVLLIDLSQTERRDDYGLGPLPQAEAEAKVIQTILRSEDLGVECIRLSNEEATREVVLNTLYEKDFKIIHFCGHGDIDEENPRNSSLCLFDGPLYTRVIAKAFGQARPLLCFINACQSAAEGLPDPGRARVYTLGRAFLQTGAYLLGSRWKINDQSARTFAEKFYTSLLVKAAPIGEAVRVARKESRKDSNDLGWASYVFYGDPRIRFMRDADSVKEMVSGGSESTSGSTPAPDLRPGSG